MKEKCLDRENGRCKSVQQLSPLSCRVHVSAVEPELFGQLFVETQDASATLIKSSLFGAYPLFDTSIGLDLGGGDNDVDFF